MPCPRVSRCDESRSPERHSGGCTHDRGQRGSSQCARRRAPREDRSAAPARPVRSRRDGRRRRYIQGSCRSIRVFHARGTHVAILFFAHGRFHGRDGYGRDIDRALVVLTLPFGSQLPATLATLEEIGIWNDHARQDVSHHCSPWFRPLRTRPDWTVTRSARGTVPAPGRARETCRRCVADRPDPARASTIVFLAESIEPSKDWTDASCPLRW